MRRGLIEEETVILEVIGPDLVDEIVAAEEHGRAMGAQRSVLEVGRETQVAPHLTPPSFAWGVGVVRALGADEALAADDEFISLGFAAHQVVVIEDEDRAAWAAFLDVDVRGGHAGEPAADDDEVVDLIGR